MMHNWGLASAFSERWKCERRKGWLERSGQETISSEQDGQVKKWLSRQLVLRNRRYTDCVLSRTRVGYSCLIHNVA